MIILIVFISVSQIIKFYTENPCYKYTSYAINKTQTQNQIEKNNLHTLSNQITS